MKAVCAAFGDLFSGQLDRLSAAGFHLFMCSKGGTKVILRPVFMWSFVLLSLSVFSQERFFQPVHSFVGPDGSNPYPPPIQATDGSFYGTTDRYNGFPESYGTVFRMMPDGSVTTLVAFTNFFGSRPFGQLIQAKNGSLYGTTCNGGSNDFGTVFQLATNGAFATRAFFDHNNGSGPYGGVIEGSDGNFYGTTLSCSNGFGTVFRMTSQGGITNLCKFNGANGKAPSGGLVEATDGHLYGTTQGGGAYDYGTVFRITTNGSLTTLASLSYFTSGGNPNCPLAQIAPDVFWGTASQGGSNEFGTIFQITTNGALTVVFTFSGTNGAYPLSGLIKAKDGALYGTTLGGGVDNCGTVFRIATNGHFNSIFSFREPFGRAPWRGLSEASDGTLYGSATHGGAQNLGVIFRMAPISLSMERVGTALMLSWPTNATGYILQSSASLDISSSSWVVVTNEPGRFGMDFVVTNSTTNVSEFFRLKK